MAANEEQTQDGMNRRTFLKSAGAGALATAAHLSSFHHMSHAASQQLAMSWDEWAKLDATAMAELVRKKKVTPKELAQQANNAVELMNPKINAVLEVFEDVVEDPHKDGMNKDGAFYGVPLLVKDAGSGMKGRLQEYGSTFMKGVRKTKDDPLIKNWRTAGFNLIGRTAIPPQESFAVTESMINGITHNPWNLDYTPGGSSGGSSAAIAAGILPIVGAADGGGSTRSPAHMVGVIGLKPTRGRLPMPAGVNEFVVHFGVEGVLTRTVRDTALAYDFMSLHRPGDSFIPISPPAGSYAEVIRRAPGELKVALSLGKWGREPDVDPNAIEKVNAAAKVLESLGHTVEEVNDGDICDWETMWPGALVNWVGGSQRWKLISDATGIPLNEETMEPVVYWLYQAAQNYDLFDFWGMQAANPIYTRQFGQFFEKYDLLLTPVDANPTPKAGPGSGYSPFEKMGSVEEAIAFGNRLIDSSRFNIPANDAGFPTIALPAGLTKDKLPCGIHLHASYGREDLLLQVAAQLEKAKPEWFNQIAPLHVSLM